MRSIIFILVTLTFCAVALIGPYILWMADHQAAAFLLFIIVSIMLLGVLALYDRCVTVMTTLDHHRTMFAQDVAAANWTKEQFDRVQLDRRARDGEST